jgi:pyrroline-5-carboxylate reductase
MIDAGVLVGLARETATALAVQTLLGSARLLAESGESPAQLRHAVTSPGGTTAAALEVLEQAALRGAFSEAIRAAAARAAELGRS